MPETLAALGAVGTPAPLAGPTILRKNDPHPFFGSMAAGARTAYSGPAIRVNPYVLPPSGRFWSAQAMQRRHLLSLAILPLGSLPLAGWGQATAALPVSTAINRAGRMRALSQRTSKAYAQASLSVLPERARDVLLISQRLIGDGMQDLARSAVPADATPLLNGLQGQIDRLGLLTAQAPRTQAVAEVTRVADDMLQAADVLTRAYERSAGQSAARVVNVAGRQRMLSQRAARAYFLAAGTTLPAAEVTRQLDTARKEFEDGLAFLQASPLSTPTIRNELELARGQWMFFDSALKRPPAPDTLQTVATTSERVYEVMDNLTSLYDHAVRGLFG